MQYWFCCWYLRFEISMYPQNRHPVSLVQDQSFHMHFSHEAQYHRMIVIVTQPSILLMLTYLCSVGSPSAGAAFQVYCCRELRQNKRRIQLFTSAISQVRMSISNHCKIVQTLAWDMYLCTIVVFCSLKMECEKLAQEKTEMQRHYVMVGICISNHISWVTFIYQLLLARDNIRRNTHVERLTLSDRVFKVIPITSWWSTVDLDALTKSSN